jgi:hypothetical protein
MVVVFERVLQIEEKMTNKKEAGFMAYYTQLSNVEGLRRHIDMIIERKDPIGDILVLEKILRQSIGTLNVIGSNQVSEQDGIIKRAYDVGNLEDNYRRDMISPENLGTYIVCLDLDNFGRINKELGDDKGDDLITLVAKSLNETLRSVDGISCVTDDKANLRKNGFLDFVEQYGLKNNERDELRKAYHLHGDEYELLCSLGSEKDLINVLLRCRDDMLNSTEKAGYRTDVTMGYSLWDVAEESFSSAEKRAVINRNKGKLDYDRGVIVGLDGKPIK